MPNENTEPGVVAVTPDNLGEAKPGYIVAKSEKGRLLLVDPSYITEPLREEIRQVAESVYRFDAFTRHVKHFKKLCKSHFMNAFLVYKTKAMQGDIEVRDMSLLYADDAVLSGAKSVRQALAENNILNDIFVKIYGEYGDEDEAEGDELSFPEV